MEYTKNRISKNVGMLYKAKIISVSKDIIAIVHTYINYANLA